ADPNDPNGDNWARTESNYYNDNINGTEGNSATPEGSYPDSEDLDGNGTSFIDNTNDYFSFSFRLEEDHPDAALVAGETRRNNGALTGWRLFRIPLVDFQAGAGMIPSWNDVKQLRIWVDGNSLAESPSRRQSVTARIEIAKIELVGNEWEEIGIAPINSDKYDNADSLITLVVTVANTEDNDDYQSPPGIQGEYDRLNDIRLREQSLVMDFRAGIDPLHKAGIRKSISQQRGSFLVYGTMDMFIHGQAEDAMMNQDTTFVWFFLRLGRVAQNGEFYYEVRQPVYPGWDDRNHIHIDMEEIAGLKLRDQPDGWELVDGDSIPKYYLDGMEVLIRGDPSLERIETYTAGVINKHPTLPIRGQVMIDELRLSNVRRERGMALRVSGALNFADLLTTSINYSRKDADFHTIQQRVTTNPVTVETIKADAKFSPDRFLPRSWRVQLPISLGYSRSIQSPKYYSGRDVLAGGLRDAPEEIQRISRQINLKTSFAKSSRSRFWLMRQTLDRLTGGVAYARKQTSSEQELRNITQSITGQAAYPIKFSDENYLEPFHKLASIPWLGAKISDTRIYYSPSNLNFSTNIAETKSGRTTRDSLETTTQNYTLSLKRAINASYRVTDRLNTSYSWSANNALDHLRYSKLEALKTLDMGYPLQLGEQYSANFDPTIFSWFSPKLNYQARYSWSKNRPIIDPTSGGRVSNQGRLSGTVNLQLKNLVEIFYTPESKGRASGRSRRRRSSGQTKDDDQKKLLEVNNPMVKGVLKQIHAVLSKVNPIALNYAYGRSVAEPAVIGQPAINYRLGLVTTTGLPIDSTINGFATLSRNRDMSVRTGFSIGKSVTVSLSHSRKWTSNQGSNATTESRTIDFLVLSDGKEVGLPFFNWSLRWSNLEKLPLLKKIPWRVSLDHSYNGSRSSNKQGDRVSNDTYSMQFQPLLGLTINFNNGISSNLRYGVGQNLSRTEAGDRKGSTRNITASASYQHRGGLKVPLPFLRDLNLQNSINFSLDFDLSSSQDEQRKGEAAKFSITRESRRWGIKPYITYTFSNKVTGSFRTGYSEIYNDITGRRIDREFGFDVNIAIRGN
ncbi:MAG: cell surface protein SprA, partial [Candidatus Marinimicrobia bacterium]|nr:cell surface protein SprA [Candidatus Neomarinimicrobiota bacterium]